MAEITSFSGKAAAADGQSLIDAAVADLMLQVGARVRRAREQKGLARRVLSEMSGVSPRYLAQLESGEGNISIGLLKRVAVALEYRVEWLVGQDDPQSSDVLSVAEQFRAADRETQQAVLDALAAGADQGQRAERICLVGLRGAGKSTLGRMAGAALDLPFVELNREIESAGGMPVEEIMALYGQEGYRRLEADALDRIAQTHERMILAVAGGIVAEPATYHALLSRFHTIWLKASPEDHMARVRAQGDTRPMQGNPEAMAQLRSILHSREALYERAHAQLDTSGQSVEDTLAGLQGLIRDRGFLD
ncbi:helix-turn-helix transcriptional regulator [Pacificoceanicola onchidii]|uniref:helix-turn-helix transcriptional regulator n=1 Tax=Pacificoceanicola onchidii TaxID=2562685 RepID=UPI0010A5DFA1|nr:helix-turn-helix transcriptional regulator [Pacificoceanicola onchidii]